MPGKGIYQRYIWFLFNEHHKDSCALKTSEHLHCFDHPFMKDMLRLQLKMRMGLIESEKELSVLIDCDEQELSTFLRKHHLRDFLRFEVQKI
jgi:hypothetical protein